jgi:hypothetical protein
VEAYRVLGDVMALGIVILVIVWLFFCAIVWSCCKVASDADKQSEECMKAMEKKIKWEKPVLVEITKAVSLGNTVACETVCDNGHNARYYCGTGSGNK